jgi:hypothetical protein
VKTRVGIISYYIFWNMLMIGKGLGFTGASKELQNITYIAIIFLVIKLFYTPWRKNEILWCFILITYGLCNWIFSKYTGVFLSILTILGSKGVSRYKLFRMALYIRAALFIYMLFTALLGLSDMEVNYRWAGGTQIMKRYSFGYGHPNAAHYAFYTLIVLYLLVRTKKLNFIHYVIITVANIFVYRYTNSRTGLTMVFLLLALIMIYNLNLVSIIRDKFISKIYILLALISISIVYLYGTISFLQHLGTLSSRFFTANNLVNTFSLTLFGIPDIETDFGYIAILYQSGIIAFFLFVMGNTILLKKAFEEKNLIKVSCLVTYGIYTMSESYSASILMNFMLIYMADFLFKDEVEEYEFDMEAT